MPLEPNENPIDPGVDIGHVHLKVGDLKKVEEFYCGILGFNVIARLPQALFIAAGSYHHHLGFNTWQSKNGNPPPAEATGLYHVAIRYPSKNALSDAVKRLRDASWPLDGVSDHGTQLSLYLRDAEQNGVELYWDRPEAEWPLDEQGHVQFTNELFDPDDLLKGKSS